MTTATSVRDWTWADEKCPHCTEPLRTRTHMNFAPGVPIFTVYYDNPLEALDEQLGLGTITTEQADRARREWVDQVPHWRFLRG